MADEYHRLRDLALSLGYVFDRQGRGDHEMWLHPGTNRKVPIPRRSPKAIRAQRNIEANLRRGATGEPWII